MSALKNYINLCKAITKGKLARKGLVGAPLPFRLNAAVTYKCNSQCKMCDIWKIYRDTKNIRQELTLNNYESIFETLSSNLFWLGLTGGEPFLRKDLIDLVLLADSTLANVQILELTTNGFSPQLIEKTIDEILNDSTFPFITLGVSIDGPSLLHDHIRGVNGSWDHAITTYKKLCEISISYPNFFPHISYTISQYNAGNFENFFTTLKNEALVDIDSISVTIENMGHLYYKRSGICSEKIYAVNGFRKDIAFALKKSDIKVRKYFKESLVETGRQIFKRYFLVSALKYLDDPIKMIIPCASLIGSCFIDPFGYLYPCTIYGKKLGNIKDSDFCSLWNSRLANKIREDIKLERCPNCWSPCEAQPSFLLSLPHCLL